MCPVPPPVLGCQGIWPPLRVRSPVTRVLGGTCPRRVPWLCACRHFPSVRDTPSCFIIPEPHSPRAVAYSRGRAKMYGLAVSAGADPTAQLGDDLRDIPVLNGRPPPGQRLPFSLADLLPGPFWLGPIFLKTLLCLVCPHPPHFPGLPQTRRFPSPGGADPFKFLRAALSSPCQGSTLLLRSGPSRLRGHCSDMHLMGPGASLPCP